LSGKIELNISELIDLYTNQNYTLTALSQKYKCSINTIRRNLMSNGIELVRRYDLTKDNLPHYTGDRNPSWKGGRFQRKDGYVMIWDNDAQSYKLEHGAIMEKKLGRKLFNSEHVHHKNEIKNDNVIENFEIKSISEHTKYHHKGKDLTKYTECVCKVCNKNFIRRTKEVERHPNTFCSRECYRKAKNNV
jgi:predicted peroxiredoxin